MKIWWCLQYLLSIITLGVSCFRQISIDKLTNRSENDEFSRSSVQKSVSEAQLWVIQLIMTSGCWLSGLLFVTTSTLGLYWSETQHHRRQDFWGRKFRLRWTASWILQRTQSMLVAENPKKHWWFIVLIREQWFSQRFLHRNLPKRIDRPLETQNSRSLQALAAREARAFLWITSKTCLHNDSLTHLSPPTTT